MFLRPATMKDHEAVLTLAKQAGFGMTSLPPDPKVLEEKIQSSEASFSGKYKKKGQESFFFVLEDSESGHIAGIVNRKKNVLGMMPHPERSSEPILGSSDGLKIFHSILNALE